MGLIQTIALGLLAAAGLALLVYWSVVLWHIARTMWALPTLRRGARLARGAAEKPAVSVFVPAHNEERVIPGLVAALRAQEGIDLRVTLCLDRCTDGTLAEARRAIGDDTRFRVLEIHQCPPDWAGKVHALDAGVRDAGEHLAPLVLFLDADTLPAPMCLASAAALLGERGLDCLSVLSTLTSRRWFERFVQPMATLELMRQYPLLKANRPEGPRPFANGQFMLWRLGAYHACGGHGAVKDELLEDLALARRLRDLHMRGGVLLDGGLLVCRMYPSWEAFVRGWKRIYTESSRCRGDRLRRWALAMRAVGSVLPLAAVLGVVAALMAPGDPLSSLALLMCLLGLAAWVGAMLVLIRIGRAAVWAIPGFVAGAWLVGQILNSAAADLRHGRPTLWGSRAYRRPAQ